MIFSRHSQFIDSATLKQMHTELTSNANWMFRNKFWRYYLVDGLLPYQQSDESSWYGNQPNIKNVREPWHALFQQIYQLAGPNFKLMRYALTGQTYGQEQELHVDTTLLLDGTFRTYLMYLNTEWDNSWGGTTDFVVDGKLVHQEFPEPGKLIEFDSQAFHIGHAPNKLDCLRLTLILHGRL